MLRAEVDALLNALLVHDRVLVRAERHAARQVAARTGRVGRSWRVSRLRRGLGRLGGVSRRVGRISCKNPNIAKYCIGASPHLRAV